MYCKNCGSKCDEILDNSVLRQKCSFCNTIHYQNPYPCVSVLVVDERHEILLGRRHENSIYPGKWCLPCGYIEYEETYAAAAIREVAEEAGIDIMPQGIINVVSNLFDNGLSTLVVVLLAYYAGQKTLEPGDDIIEAAWFDVDNRLPPLAFQADDFIISKFRNCLKDNIEIGVITLDGFSFVNPDI